MMYKRGTSYYSYPGAVLVELFNVDGVVLSELLWSDWRCVFDLLGVEVNGDGLLDLIFNRFPFCLEMALGAGDIKILFSAFLFVCLVELSSLSYEASSWCRPLQNLPLAIDSEPNVESGSSRNSSAFPGN